MGAAQTRNHLLLVSGAFGEGFEVEKLLERRCTKGMETSISKHFSDTSADLRKFVTSIIKMRISKPFDVTDTEQISKDVAIHMGINNVANYDQGDFDVTK